MKFIDFHTHRIYDPDSEVLGISNFIMPENEKDWEGIENQDFANFGSIGIHPWYINVVHFQKQVFLFENILLKNKHLMIGECGLDRLIAVDFDLQKQVFKTQLAIAEKLNRSVIIHNVKAIKEVIFIRKNEFPTLKMAVHGFLGNLQQAESLIKQKVYLSFGSGFLMNHKKTMETFFNIPTDSFFLETDDQHEASIEEIYKKAAEIRKISSEELMLQIHKNYYDFK